MEGLAYLPAYGLQEDEHTVGLDTAGSRSGAAAHNRHTQEHYIGPHREGRIVGYGKSGGGDGTYGLERSAPHSTAKGRNGSAEIQRQAGDQRHEDHYAQIKHQHGTVERLQRTAYHRQIYQAEMH